MYQYSSETPHGWFTVEQFPSSYVWSALCLCPSSGAVHRHDAAEPVGAAHRALLPEAQPQRQETGLSCSSWIQRSFRVTVDWGLHPRAWHWQGTSVLPHCFGILSHTCAFLTVFFIPVLNVPIYFITYQWLVIFFTCSENRDQWFLLQVLITRSARAKNIRDTVF